MDRPSLLCVLIIAFILYVLYVLWTPRRRPRHMCPRDARHARELSEFFSADPAHQTSSAIAPTTSYANAPTTSYANAPMTSYANANIYPTDIATSYANNQSRPDSVITSSAYTNPNSYGNGQATTTIQDSIQTAIDFSDLGTTAEKRTDMVESEELGQHAVSVNQRYDAAKRKVAEYKLKPGVYDHKQRRRLVEALLRRPACGRRVRSWRTENSDTLRGDAVPKTVSSWGLMRMGGSNPAIDLHPGALGTLSGMSGKWLSDENVPDNAIDDTYM